MMKRINKKIKPTKFIIPKKGSFGSAMAFFREDPYEHCFPVNKQWIKYKKKQARDAK